MPMMFKKLPPEILRQSSVALALALALPDDVPECQEIIVVAFAVVAFSIFVQGLTMPWLIRRLGLLLHVLE